MSAATPAVPRLHPGLAALALAVPVAVVVLAAGLLPMPQNPLAWLGVAGPMTGSTRAWLSLFQGDVFASFAWNPLFWFWGLWVALAYAELWQAALGYPAGRHGIATTAFTRLSQHRVLGPLALTAILVTLAWQNLPWSWVGGAY